MKMVHRRIFSKLISITLFLIIGMLSIPVAFAAQVTLTTTNITQNPKAEGTIYYGQTVGDCIVLSGGEVQYNGTVIPGKFVHTDPTFRPTGGGTVAVRTSFTFTPEDSATYSSIAVRNSRNVTYMVTPTTPVLADENDKPIVATEVEAGTTLSTVSISGGKVQNPYYPEESRFISQTWSWVDPNTVLEKSGYYDAKITGDGKNYSDFIYSIYIEVTGSTIVPIIEKSVIEIEFENNYLWSDLNLDTCKAYTENEDGEKSEVSGLFAITNYWMNRGISVGSHEIDVIFTPTDTETYSTVEFKLPVTVNKGAVKFVDESGNETIPEITIDRVLEVGDDLNGYLKPYLNASCSFNYEETEGYGEKIKPGTHEYTVKTIIDDPNYERYGTLTFKIVLNKEKVNAKVKNVVGGRAIYFEGGDVIHLNGDFDVKYFIDGKEAGTIEGIKLNEKFEIKQNKSGVYTYEIVYNGTEDDYYDITVITEAEDIKLQHQVKVAGQEPITYTYGEKVTVTAPAHEKPYYVFTGWGNSAFAPAEDDGEVSDTFTFSMPDEDVEIEATYEFSIKAFFEYIFSLIVDFFAKIAEFLQLQKVCDFFAGIFAV